MSDYTKFNIEGHDNEFTLTEETDDYLSLFAEVEGRSLKISLIDMSELNKDDDADVKFIPIEFTMLEREYSDEELKKYIDRFQYVKAIYKQNKSLDQVTKN